jgi:2-methylcitrate dehydratase PrpD
MAWRERSFAGERCTDAFVELISGARLETLAPGALERARMSMIDTIGVTVAGSATDMARKLRRLYNSGAVGTASVTVLGSEDQRGLLDGVLCNAYAAHALDFDDTVQGVTTHPSCHLVPALLGLAQGLNLQADFGDFLLAYLVGIEVEGRLAKAVNPAHAKRGWHTTGTLGTIATAAASARLLDLPAEQIRGSLAIACSSASGLRANFGSAVKPLHAALAARAGLESALLARSGFEGGQEPFEHQFGFFAAYLGDREAFDRSQFDVALMLQCRIALDLTLKPYPCCGEATSLVQGALQLRGRLETEGVAEVRLGVTPFGREILEFDDPRSGDEARFSAQYCVATALSRGALRIRDFDPSALRDDAVRALMKRTVIEIDPAVSGHGGSVRVRTVSGSELDEQVQVPIGHASVGMPSETAQAKFDDCTQKVVGRAGARQLYARLANLDLAAPAVNWL